MKSETSQQVWQWNNLPRWHWPCWNWLCYHCILPQLALGTWSLVIVSVGKLETILTILKPPPLPAPLTLPSVVPGFQGTYVLYTGTHFFPHQLIRCYVLTALTSLRCFLITPYIRPSSTGLPHIIQIALQHMDSQTLILLDPKFD